MGGAVSPEAEQARGSGLRQEDREEGIKKAREEESRMEVAGGEMDVGTVEIGLIEEWIQEVTDAMPAEVDFQCQEDDLAWDDVHGGSCQ